MAINVLLLQPMCYCFDSTHVGRQTQLGSLSRNSQEPTRECLQTGLNDYEESTFNGISSPQAPGRHNAPQNYEARPTVDYEFPVAKTQDYKIKSAQNYEVPLSSVSKVNNNTALLCDW